MLNKKRILSCCTFVLDSEMCKKEARYVGVQYTTQTQYVKEMISSAEFAEVWYVMSFSL